MQNPPFLTVTGLSKRYEDERVGYTALNGISFEIAAGEFVAVRGPSGCGKSTLLHLLGAMDRPSAGEVELGGRRLEKLTDDQLASVRRRHIGFVFQAYNLLPTLTAQENVSLPLSLDGCREPIARQRARQALEEVDLADRAEHFPTQLSGGEMQRVAIARALAIEPEIIIADEPTGSLDSVNGNRVLELLTRLNRTRGLTIVMATHSAEAAAFASRTIYLRDGCLEGAGGTHVVPVSV